MNDFSIAATRYTPEVRYSSQDNMMDISGRSFPENTINFYSKLEEFLPRVDCSRAFVLRFYFDYLNSSSIISILRIIRYFEEQQASIRVEWHFEAEDEEIMNVGKDIARLVNTEVALCETA
jgi:hypothetical protein